MLDAASPISCESGGHIVNRHTNKNPLRCEYGPTIPSDNAHLIPVLLGMNVCPANAVGPQMNPFVFCGGSTSDPNTAAAWQVPLVKALAEKNKDKVKLSDFRGKKVLIVTWASW